MNVSFRTLFVAGLAKISVEFRSELGSNAEIDCLIDYVPRNPRSLIISSYTASRSGEPGGLVPHANDTDRARAAWSRQTTTAAFVELAVRSGRAVATRGDVPDEKAHTRAHTPAHARSTHSRCHAPLIIVHRPSRRRIRRQHPGMSRDMRPHITHEDQHCCQQACKGCVGLTGHAR